MFSRQFVFDSYSLFEYENGPGKNVKSQRETRISYSFVTSLELRIVIDMNVTEIGIVLSCA